MLQKLLIGTIIGLLFVVVILTVIIFFPTQIDASAGTICLPGLYSTYHQPAVPGPIIDSYGRKYLIVFYAKSNGIFSWERTVKYVPFDQILDGSSIQGCSD